MAEDNGELLVKPPVKRMLFIAILVVMVLMYWAFAHFMERIDMTASLTAMVNGRFPAITTLPAPFVTMVELFSPRVLRHFIPVAVGWTLAYFAAVSLVRVLYELPDNAFARTFLGRLVTGQSSDKPVVVSSRTLETMRPEHVMLRVGGPGFLVVPPGEVAVTEVNGRYYHLLSSGKHKLKPFEYVHTLVSLRTQERHETAVPLVTKDGIDLSADFTITFHIDSGGELPTRAKPFPYSPEAVESAAYARLNAGKETTFTWQDIPVNITKGQLAALVTKYTLDELLHPSGKHEPHYILTQELERNVRTLIADIGLELDSIRLSPLELPEPVAQQYLKHWQSDLDIQIRLALADSQATSLEETELARTEAEVIMIQAIMEGLENARRAGDANTMREVIALRLVEALEKMARQAHTAQPLPMYLLPQIETLRQQLLPGPQLLNNFEETEQ
jgi:regulator of protease activity HflC (stomatin/prohibitin superfamily)